MKDGHDGGDRENIYLEIQSHESVSASSTKRVST